MTFILKLIGSALMLTGALYISREYELLLEKRLGVYRGFAELLSHIRRRIDGYLTPPSHLLDGFESHALDDLGFTQRARSVGISEAYLELSDKLPQGKKAREHLHSFFCNFGKDYKEETVKAIDFALDGLREHIAALVAENEKNLKLVRTLCVATVLGIIIFLI